MKVFFGSIGNPTTFICRRIEALQSGGIEVMVDWNYHPKSLHGKDFQLISSVKFNLKRLFFPWLFPKLFLHSFRFFRQKLKYSPKASLKKALFLCEVAFRQPQVIHVQWTAAAMEYYPMEKVMNIPVIAAVRGTQLTTSPKISPRSKKLLEQTLNYIQWYQTVSFDLLKKLETHDVPTKNIINNYNGVNLEVFKNLHQRTFKQQPLSMIMVARNYWSKCIESSFFMMYELDQRGIPFEFTWVGADPKDPYYNHLLERLNLSSKVQFIDRMDADELVEAYNKSDLIISTSVAEGLANVILEAMATGCIPVVWDCEGMKEAIDQGISGFVLPFGQISGMVDTIHELYLDPEKRKMLSLQSEQRVNRLFNEKIHAEKMIIEYEKLFNLYHQNSDDSSN